MDQNYWSQKIVHKLGISIELVGYQISFCKKRSGTPICDTTKMVMQVALLALSAGKPTLRCTIASITEDSCALIVSNTKRRYRMK